MAEEGIGGLPLAGQRQIWGRLLAAHGRRRIAGSYLFHGPPGVGKEGFAVAWAALLNCQQQSSAPCGACHSCRKIRRLQHPNVTLVFPLPRDSNITSDDEPVKALSAKSLDLLAEQLATKEENPYAKIALPRANRILINSIRELRRTLFLKAAEPGRKMVLIFDAEKLMMGQGEAANALLKILEEPPDNTTFVLTTDEVSALSATIRSRCQPVFFPPLGEPELEKVARTRLGATATEARLLASMAQGSVRALQRLAEEGIAGTHDRVRSLARALTSNSAKEMAELLSSAWEFRSSPKRLDRDISLLSGWFHDAARLRSLREDAHPVFEEAREEIERFVAAYPDGDFSAIAMDLQQFGTLLRQNRNPSLALLHLVISARRNLGARA